MPAIEQRAPDERNGTQFCGSKPGMRAPVPQLQLSQNQAAQHVRRLQPQRATANDAWTFLPLRRSPDINEMQYLQLRFFISQLHKFIVQCNRLGLSGILSYQTFKGRFLGTGPFFCLSQIRISYRVQRFST